jgi:hypothetical protein
VIFDSSFPTIVSGFEGMNPISESLQNRTPCNRGGGLSKSYSKPSVLTDRRQNSDRAVVVTNSHADAKIRPQISQAVRRREKQRRLSKRSRSRPVFARLELVNEFLELYLDWQRIVLGIFMAVTPPHFGIQP